MYTYLTIYNGNTHSQNDNLQPHNCLILCCVYFLCKVKCISGQFHKERNKVKTKLWINVFREKLIWTFRTKSLKKKQKKKKTSQHPVAERLPLPVLFMYFLYWWAFLYFYPPALISSPLLVADSLFFTVLRLTLVSLVTDCPLVDLLYIWRGKHSYFWTPGHLKSRQESRRLLKGFFKSLNHFYAFHISKEESVVPTKMSQPLYGHTYTHMHTHGQPTTIQTYTPTCARTHTLSHRRKPVYNVPPTHIYIIMVIYPLTL